ncbi:hypothetical protein BHE74_00036482 [Ensete ventricosum]|nr:hypothetical protein BHE74_00036482 [Ensete ventricosum]
MLGKVDTYGWSLSVWLVWRKGVSDELARRGCLCAQARLRGPDPQVDSVTGGRCVPLVKRPWPSNGCSAESLRRSSQKQG